MWTNRLDLATLPAQRALAGPGSFPNPDFLEVGYSPRAFKGRAQSLTEQRSMFTLWAALPGPLILSADLRKSSWNTVRKPTAFFHLRRFHIDIQTIDLPRQARDNNIV